MPRNAPAALFENRCLDGAELLPDNVHRRHEFDHSSARPKPLPTSSVLFRQALEFSTLPARATHGRGSSLLDVVHSRLLPALPWSERTRSGRMLPGHLANARVVTLSQFRTAFFACTFSAATSFRKLAAAAIGVTLARASGPRLCIHQQGTCTIQAFLRHYPAQPPPSLGSTIFDSAQSNHPPPQ